MEQRAVRNLSTNSRNQIHPTRTAFILLLFPGICNLAAREEVTGLL
jgi:hypothetical protein